MIVWGWVGECGGGEWWFKTSLLKENCLWGRCKKKVKKTNNSAFSATHTYIKLTLVSFFLLFFMHFSLIPIKVCTPGSFLDDQSVENSSGSDSEDGCLQIWLRIFFGGQAFEPHKSFSIGRPHCILSNQSLQNDMDTSHNILLPYQKENNWSCEENKLSKLRRCIVWAGYNLQKLEIEMDIWPTYLR